MKSKYRGFTLIEVLSVILIFSVISGISFVYLRDSRLRSLTNEAKIELSLLYRSQKAYYLKYGQFADGIEQVVFPSGAMRYNVGHINHPDKPKHNFYQICGKGNSDCSMVHGKKANVMDSHTDAKCVAGNTANPGKTFKAYAVGDIYDDDGKSPDNKWDKWWIDQDGQLSHCQDPLNKEGSC